MQKFPANRAALAVLLFGVLPFTACDAPQSTEVPHTPEFSSISGASLLECPSSEARAARGRIALLGGIVALDDHVVVVPFGAVLRSLEIEIEEPAGRHMLVNLSANGREHWQFLQPLTVTIDYARCPASKLDEGPLSVWLVDPVTGEMLQSMGGVDNRLLRRITFITDHFSGYAIAN